MVQDKRWLLIIYTVGTLFSFLLYGILQERIMTQEYGPQDYFTDTIFLLFSNRIAGIMMASIGLLLEFDGTKGSRVHALRPVAPFSTYLLISLINLASTFSQYEALKYVTFPTQTLAKCAKIISVMIIGSIINGKSYSKKDYLFAFLITIGCSMFLTTGNIEPKGSDTNSAIGLFLLFLNLLFDGFTSSLQDRFFRGYNMSSLNQMFYVSICSMVITFSYEIFSKNIIETSKFIITYPHFLYDAAMLSLASSLGQLFINHTIKDFGPVTNSLIMTLRQFLSLLLSAIIFLHPLTILQMIGATIVFIATYGQSFVLNSRSKPSSTLSSSSSSTTVNIPA